LSIDFSLPKRRATMRAAVAHWDSVLIIKGAGGNDLPCEQLVGVYTVLRGAPILYIATNGAGLAAMVLPRCRAIVTPCGGASELMR
jgi:hypothetical protein